MRRHGYCQGRPPLKHFRSLWGERGSGGAGDESRRPPRRHKRNLFVLLHAEANLLRLTGSFNHKTLRLDSFRK